MDTFDAITIQAALKVLAQQQEPLPAEVQRSLHAIGQDLANQRSQPSRALLGLLEQHPNLKHQYDIAYQDWLRKYQEQERTKSLEISLGNGSQMSLENLIHILNSDDSTITARQEIERLTSKSQPESDLWQRGDRIIALTAGGAALGGTLGQIPGAIAGGLLAAAFAWFSNAPKKPAERNAR